MPLYGLYCNIIRHTSHFLSTAWNSYSRHKEYKHALCMFFSITLQFNSIEQQKTTFFGIIVVCCIFVCGYFFGVRVFIFNSWACCHALYFLHTILSVCACVWQYDNAVWFVSVLLVLFLIFICLLFCVYIYLNLSLCILQFCKIYFNLVNYLSVNKMKWTRKLYATQRRWLYLIWISFSDFFFSAFEWRSLIH